MGAVTTQVLGGLSESIGLGKCFALMGIILLIALILQLGVLKPESDDKDGEETDSESRRALDLEAETAEA